MKNIKTIKKIEDKKLKLENFSKIAYLKRRWGEEKLNNKQLKKYNKWSTDEKYKVIVIELKLEHYLTTNILFDLNGVDNLFKEENREKYFSKIRENDSYYFDKIMKKILRNDIVNIQIFKKMSFGDKLMIWKYLKKGIFKNKFMGIDRKYQKPFITALDNIRLIRNGISHMHSEKQIYDSMKQIDSSKKNSKEEIYKLSFSLANRGGKYE